MELLITKADVSEVLQVAIGYNEQEFNVFIREAQDFDYRELVCEDFFNDMIRKHDEEPYLKLIAGGDYEYDQKEYNFRGLKDVLCYFTYARFILKCNYTSTSHGFTIKKTPHSEPMSLEERRNMYYKYKKEANLIHERVVMFIERSGNYDLWDACNEPCKSSVSTSFKTKVIK